MDFIEFSQLLFNRLLLASAGTVKEVHSKYELAVLNTPEYVGLVKNVKSERTIESSKIYQGTDGSRIGILPVKGALIYEETGWEALCGMTSYEGLQNKAEYMIKEKQIDHLILELNSGGGMAYGCFETAQYVKNLAKEHGVKITSYVDGVAYSGGYAWCCIADEVIVNPMGKVGSIGVVLPLVNTSERDKKEGIKTIYVTAGKSKVPYDEDGNFTKEALTKIQKDVMVTYDMFVDHVADMRGIDRELVINTEASTFGTEESLKLGLIDQVMTKADFYEYLGNFNGEPNMSLTPKDAETKVTTDSANSQVMAQLSDQIKELKVGHQALADQVATLTKDRDEAVQGLGLANEQIKTLTTQLDQAKIDAGKAVVDSRTARISALVAVDDVEDHMSFVDGFSDEKFDKYVAKLALDQEKLATSFKPQGKDVDGEGNEKVSVEASVTARIKERQGQK